METSFYCNIINILYMLQALHQWYCRHHQRYDNLMKQITETVMKIKIFIKYIHQWYPNCVPWNPRVPWTVVSGVPRPDSDKVNIPCFGVSDIDGTEKLTTVVFSISLQQNVGTTEPLNLIIIIYFRHYDFYYSVSFI